jgi:tungstate transport system substrate-binding protein
MVRPRTLRLPLIGRALALLSAVALVAGCDHPPAAVILATTTSVGNSGLLDQVLPRSSGPEVRVALVGSGRALDMLADGHADVAITHAPAREQAALSAHPAWYYRKILFNDFLIVGPPQDPARVRASSSAVAAMRTIAGSRAAFLSRGDQSGTHEREEELWRLAGVRPGADRLIVAGAGMGQTLRIASSTGAYTLTDRGTYESLRQSLQLAELHSGDRLLMNTYAVVAPPERSSGLAFARWLAEGEGQKALADALSSGGIRGFQLWPSGGPKASPGDMPTGDQAKGPRQ